MTAAKILVVDDDPRIAAAVRRALAYEGHDVSVAHDGYEALSAVRRDLPDLVVLDVMMPGIDGMTVCSRIREHDPAVPVLMLTAKSEVDDRVAGLDAGADDYLVKPFAYEELLARVRALLRRATPADRDLLRYAHLTMDVEAMEIRVDDQPIDLTALEFRLLEYFLRNPRVVLSRDQIRMAVWGVDEDPNSNVVDVYVGYLRTKLERHGDPRVIQTVRGAGYVLREA